MTSPGASTAALTPPTVLGVGGFGQGPFGGTLFGGWVTTVTAVLAGNGVGTAVVTEVPVLAELQYV